MKRLLHGTAVLLFSSIAAVNTANSALIFNIVEQGGNVEVSLSGSLDLSATLGFGGTASNTTPFFSPTQGLVTVGNVQSDFYNVNSWTSIFGSGSFQTWDTTSGDRVAMFSNPAIGVPLGYISGNPLSGSATKFGATFASLGMSTGSYVNVLTNGNSTDTVTINVGQGEPPPKVPLPGTVALFTLGMKLIGLARRRRAP